jgi:hypothetical protein
MARCNRATMKTKSYSFNNANDVIIKKIIDANACGIFA